ncbi:RDD family protein [Lysobacter sp. 1R34A]|uniref:RDD family protein n=1 Tax=Lysobacter sp. 1R34A TaxID=3445786 RepID=UPI003EECC91C
MEETQNPYAAPNMPALPNAEWQQTVRADRGMRLVARLIDGGLSLMCFLPMFVAVAIDPESKEPSAIQMAMMGLSVLLLLGLFVYNLVLLNQSGQTLGKRWIGIKIVRTDGTPASLGRILGLRMFLIALIEAIPCLGGVFALVNVLWIFGEDSLCLHDLMADTKVVNA